MAPRTQVNSATLIMGPTGSGKSSLARTLADYLWERHKKVLYYYNCDGGGFPAPVQEGIAIGIIKGFRMRTRDPGDLGLAFETCYRAAQGWWPRRIKPSTCEVEPGVEMVPPIAKKWEMYCPQGHLVKRVISQQLLTPQICPTCTPPQMVTTQNMQVREVLIENKGFEDRGGCFFDGLTSMLSWEMMELGQRAGKLELKGEEGAIGGKVISGSLSFGGVTRSHVGFAQTRGEELCHLALGIPHLLVPPVFTALSMEATDEGALSIVGPKIAGRAKTDEAGQWVGNCWETAIIPALEGAGTQRCLYLSEFIDAQGRRHLLKHRGAPGTMPDRLLDPPNDTRPFSEFNLGKAFKLLDDALTTGIDRAMQIYPDAPGLAEGMVEFGDGGKTETPAPPHTAAPLAVMGAGASAGATAAPVAAPAPTAKKTTAKKTTPAPTPPPVAATAAPAPVQETAPPPPVAEPQAPAAPVQEAPTPVAAAAPPAPRPPQAAPRPVAAPPPGARRVAGPAPSALPAAATPAAPGAIVPPAVSSAPRPVAAAPRPPAAAPRPPTVP